MTTATGGAREGARYGVVNTYETGNSVNQDVTTNVLARRSYSLSMWVKSASGRPLKGTLALFGILNTESEGTGTNFTAGADWTLVTASLNTTRVHDALRTQVYLHTEGDQLLVDGAQLFDTGIVNSSWEFGSWDGWTAERDTGTAPVPDARDGARVGVVSAPAAGRSMYVGLVAGQSYTFSVWMRSQDGRPVNGQVVNWGIGSAAQEAGTTAFTVGGAWTLVSATVSPSRGDYTVGPTAREGTSYGAVSTTSRRPRARRVTVTCTKKACRKTVTKGKGAKRVRITRLSNRRLRSGTKITVTVTAPGRLTAKVVDTVRKGRRVAGRRHCSVPGTSKPSITC